MELITIKTNPFVNVTMVHYFRKRSSSSKELSFLEFNWNAGRLKNVFGVGEALLKLGGSCCVRGTDYGRAVDLSWNRGPS